MNNETQDTTRLHRRPLLAAGGTWSVTALALVAGQAQAQQAWRSRAERR